MAREYAVYNAPFVGLSPKVSAQNNVAQTRQLCASGKDNEDDPFQQSDRYALVNVGATFLSAADAKALRDSTEFGWTPPP